MDNATAIFEDIKTIISVLQTHTDLIMNLRRDHKALSIKVAEVDMETQTNKKNVKILEVETQHMKKDIENLFRLSDEFRKEMDELSGQVAELYVLKKQVAEQKEYMENLAAQFHKFATDTTEYVANTTKTMGVLQTSCDQTQFQLKEMKEYVDHFADNLILNSQQIMVDSYSGFANRPLTLTEILRMCRNTLDEVQAVDSTQNEQIRKAFADLDTKAPDSVLFNITTLEKKVGTIELHIQKEEEQGMGALRKTCEELSVHMQSVQLELEEKIDRESVGFIVHEKYEEIVRYLQDALQSSLEDENSFKQKADEIQEMVILLSNSKADRTEIANMQEIMVKSEALLKKVGAQVNLKDKIKELVPRKDLEALLAGKVDRAEFDQQLQSAVQNSRRNRYQNAVSTGLQPVVDEALAAGGGGYGGGYGGTYTTQMVGAGDEERQPASVSGVVVHRPGSSGARSGRGKSQTPALPSVPHTGGGGGSKSAKLPTSSGHTGPLPLVDHGRFVPPGGQLSDSEGELPVMAIGQSMASSPTTSGKDFGAFAKGRAQKSKAIPGATTGTAAGPPGTSTGTFSATQGGRPTGQPFLMSASTPSLGAVSGGPAPQLPDGYGASEFPYADAPLGRATYAEQQQLTDHLAYLHGPTVGGGFNAKSAHIVRGMPTGNPVQPDDVEGKGMMLHGDDGHMYYKDLNDAAGGHQ